MRSKFNTCSLREVLKMIADASLVPGDLQVPYAWSKQDVINFMSNIMKGYPSGNVLVWQPNEDDKSGICVLPSMGPINFLPSKGHRSYILNGVNRFTSLMWMRCGPSDAWAPTENERAVWMDGTEFMLDPKTGEFDFYDMLDARKKLLVPASAIINYDMAFMRDWDKQMTLAGFSEQEIEEGFSAHEKAASMFNESRMTLTEIGDASVHEAKDAYINICRPGDDAASAHFDVFASIVPQADLDPAEAPATPTR